MRKPSRYSTIQVSTHKILTTFNKASPTQLEDGLEWYKVAHHIADNMAHTYGTDIACAAGVIAALSPSVPWERNILDAKAVMSENRNWNVSTYGPNLTKAQRILGGKHPLNVLGGQKVLAFYHLIMNPEDPLTVCVDRHAVKVCTRKQWENETEASQFLRIGYEKCADAYRKVAGQLGLLPSQVQAVTWLIQRSKTQ